MHDLNLLVSEFVQKCKNHSLSVTPQRLAIYKALLNDKTHPNPECVYKAIKSDFPTISLATVYKTLETFEKHQIINVVTPLHETVRYDAEMDRHHHVVCVKCKKVMDIKDPELDKINIPTYVSSDNQVLDYNIQINVICQSCKAA